MKQSWAGEVRALASDLSLMFSSIFCSCLIGTFLGLPLSPLYSVEKKTMHYQIYKHHFLLQREILEFIIFFSATFGFQVFLAIKFLKRHLMIWH